MKTAHLDDMTRGWFVGDFEPSLLKTRDVEVAVKAYRKGDTEEQHYHKLATEITVVVSGRVRMNGVEYGPGSIILLEPNEPTDFEALEDSINTVVKYPGASDDKYPGKPQS
jgi:quercetin dioxygenase-like cupin family protein